jgi:hypothetical protein
MSGSFIAVALIVVIMIVFWRLTLVVVAALLISILVTGVGAVTNGLATADRTTTSIIDPAPTLPAQATPPR